MVVEFSLAGCWAVRGGAAVGGWVVTGQEFLACRGGQVGVQWLNEVIHCVEGQEKVARSRSTGCKHGFCNCFEFKSSVDVACKIAKIEKK